MCLTCCGRLENLPAVQVVGRNYNGVPDNPCRVKRIPSPIPAKQWYLRPPVIALTGGLLPFGSIFIETYFIFTSFWNYKARGSCEGAAVSICAARAACCWGGVTDQPDRTAFWAALKLCPHATLLLMASRVPVGAIPAPCWKLGSLLLCKSLAWAGQQQSSPNLAERLTVDPIPWRHRCTTCTASCCWCS